MNIPNVVVQIQPGSAVNKDWQMIRVDRENRIATLAKTYGDFEVKEFTFAQVEAMIRLT